MKFEFHATKDDDDNVENTNDENEDGQHDDRHIIRKWKLDIFETIL